MARGLASSAPEREAKKPFVVDEFKMEELVATGRATKAQVAELIARIPGLRPVNAGTLETARLIEGLTPLLISVNARYKTHAGVKLTGLPDELW